jgi:hypothetical protein
MAWTLTRYKTVFGNKAAVGIKVVTDSATTNIETGLKNIEWFALGPASMATSCIHITPNVGVSSTSLAGYVGVTGCAGGDEFYLTVFGTR